MANSITSLRTVAAFSWPEFVESMSVTDEVLREDPAGIYSAMTFEARDLYRHVIEVLAKRSSHSEASVARTAIDMARQADPSAEADAPGTSAPDPSGDGERRSHVGYYLIDRGRPALERTVGYTPTLAQRFEQLWREHPGPLYFSSIALATLAALAAVIAPLPAAASVSMGVLALILACVPASEIGIAVVNQLITSFVAPDRLPRMDYAKSGVPEANRTLVVVPLLLDSPAAARDALDHLETQFLANRDAEIRFALLGDFTDAASESLPTDAAIVEALEEGVRALNREYADTIPFYVFQRPRRRNERQGVWMGWERKRGKLEQLNAFLRGEARDAFSVVEGDIEWLSGVRYVITLDSDSLLPRGVAAALIGTIAHPLHRAVFVGDGTRVVRGYGILQPRVGVTLESANQSRFASHLRGTSRRRPVHHRRLRRVPGSLRRGHLHRQGNL